MSLRDSTELVIGDEPQFFFDNFLLEEVQNVTRTMHAPKNMDGILSSSVINPGNTWWISIPATIKSGLIK